MSFAGTLIPAPVESYHGHLPETLVASRAGLETLLRYLCSQAASASVLTVIIRRLVLGRGNYRNIVQIAGTVIGLSPHSDDLSRIGRVKIRRTDSRIEELDANLVIGTWR